MPTSDDLLICDLPTGSKLIARHDLHEDHDTQKARWFTSGKSYRVESMHPIANPPYVTVKCDDGMITKLYAEHISERFI